MREASLAGESLRSIARRFGVLYNSLTRRVHQDEFYAENPDLAERDGRSSDKLWHPEKRIDNVVELFKLDQWTPQRGRR